MRFTTRSCFTPGLLYVDTAGALPIVYIRIKPCFTFCRSCGGVLTETTLENEVLFCSKVLKQNLDPTSPDVPSYGADEALFCL